MKFKIKGMVVDKVEPVSTVDGRDLHSELLIRKRYSVWIKTQIERLNLVLKEDYVISTPSKVYLEVHPKIEYYFTLNSAKHIAMISLTEKGREVRQYFIDCEEELKRRTFGRLDKANIKLRKENESLKSFKKLHEVHNEDSDGYKLLSIRIKGKSIKVGKFRIKDLDKARDCIKNIRKDLGDDIGLEEKKTIIREEIEKQMGYRNIQRRQTLDQYHEDLKIA